MSNPNDEHEIYCRSASAEPEQSLTAPPMTPGQSQSEHQKEPTFCSVAWCDDRGESGHSYDSIVSDGRVVRCHSAEIGHLATPTNAAPWEETSVELIALQMLGSGELETPQLRLYASSSQLTSAQARQVAGWLTNAADQLDKVLGRALTQRSAS